MIAIICAVCGSKLYNEYHAHPEKDLFFTVDPCEKCLIEAEKGARADDFLDKAALSALTGFIGRAKPDEPLNLEEGARMAYAMAEAMLEVRERMQMEGKVEHEKL